MLSWMLISTYYFEIWPDFEVNIIIITIIIISILR